MMDLLCQIGRAGLPARLALAFFLLDLVLLSPFVTAQTGAGSRVSDSILGVRIGTSFEDARKKLEPLCIASDRPTATDEGKHEGGTKRVWRLKGTNYTSVALKTNKKGRVVWVTGFVRPSKELLFSELGDTSLAVRATDSQAIWNVATPNGGYRLVAKGQNGRARVIYLLSLATPFQ
jgi:hypothetical protein